MLIPRPLHAVLLPTLSLLLLPAAALGATPWEQKVDPWVRDTVASAASTEALIVLDEQADLSAAAAIRDKNAKGRYVFNRLQEVAARTQPPLRALLDAHGIEHRPFWVANMIWVRGDRAALEMLAARSDVSRLAANPSVAFEPPRFAEHPQKGGACPQGVEANLTHVGADTFWNLGFLGQGVVVAGQDTGYDWDHPALLPQYRGWNDVTATADHNYNWHDAIHSSSGICGANATAPCDDSNHGSHTMGIAVGDNGSSRIGMAPQAKWIGCRNMNSGNGTPSTYAECFEFFLAPTDLAGANPDPDRAPHVINNSWGCPGFEGCTDPNVMLTLVENVRAAGIVVVVSAGNAGSGCSSISTVAPIYDAAFTVGSTDNNDGISGFSSRGPVTVDGSNRLKPDVTAPGETICSSVRGGNYAQFGWSGTSMAGPHVAGLVALLISAQPCLAGNVDAIEQHILDTVVPRTTGQTCGGVPGSQVPNNTYGYGAVRAVMPDASLCGGLFADGFESGTLSQWSLVVPAP